MSNPDSEKQQRKRKRKEAKLRQTLIELEQVDIELEQAKIELANAKDARALSTASPDLTGNFGFNHAVTESTVEHIKIRLLSFATRNPEADITLSITSPGGSVFDGLHLYATLRDLSARGHHVTTIASGFAASMGAVLLQAGDHRVIGAESLLMLHEISSVAIGKAGEIRRESEFLDRVTKQFCDICARRSNLSSEEIQANIDGKDWWVWPQEAVELGLADEVRAA